MHSRPTAARLATAVSLIVAIGCSGEPVVGVPVQQPSSLELRRVLVGEAATALGPDGLFRIDQAARQADELSAATAMSIARVWVRKYAPMTLPFLESTHGGTLNTVELSTCGRALYSRSSFASPPADLVAPYRRVFGSWWLVTFCDAAQQPSVSVAVSALATELRVDGNRLAFGELTGNEIVGIGIPRGHRGEYPSSPEAAVTFAASVSGSLVSGVPELVAGLQDDGPPQSAKWRIPLAGAASLRAGSRSVTTREMYVGSAAPLTSSLASFAASDSQEESISFRWTPPPMMGENGVAYSRRSALDRRLSAITRRGDLPNRFTPVSSSGGR